MFQSLVISRISKKYPYRFIILAVSLLLHISLVGFIYLKNFLIIPSIRMPPISVTLVSQGIYVEPPPPERITTSQGQAHQRKHPEDSFVMKTYELKDYSENLFELTELSPDLDLSHLLDDTDSSGTGEGGPGITGGMKGPGGSYNLPFTETPDYMRMSSEMIAPRKLKGSPPEYPVLAQRAGIDCLMILEAKINTNGEVVDLTVLRSCPIFTEMFEQSVREALSTWRYAPAILYGNPVNVRYVLTITFNLH